MPQVRFEPTTPVFEREKTVHALDRAATVVSVLQTCSLTNLVLLINYMHNIQL
jgi:hypothetical protein